MPTKTLSTVDLAIEPVRLDREELLRHAHGADAGVLLAAVVQVSGDTSLLERFGPLIQTPPPNFTGRLLPQRLLAPEPLEELVQIAAELFTGEQPESYTQVLDDETFARALAAATGEAVPAEFVASTKEQSGFTLSIPDGPSTGAFGERYKTIVLGAGMSGIAAGIALGHAGYDFEIIESSDDIGGTWRLNNYPGVAVDTPSIYYSYSFHIKTDWSKYFPLGAEYQAYLRDSVEKFGLLDRITFNTTITRMAWDDAAQEWEVTTLSGGVQEVRRAKFVITARGFLNRPKLPTVPGIADFTGVSLHSTEWSPEVDVRGKRVGVVGAGATAVQLVDGIFDDVEHLTLFQRQPHWVLPNRLGTGDVPEAEAWLQANLPFYARWQRAKTYMFTTDKYFPKVRVDPEWIKTHDLSISEANHESLTLARNHLAESIPDDAEKRRKLTPDFAPNSKRIIRDPGGYYAALASSKSDIVDAGIERITPTGILSSDGVLTELDVIVYATGFTLDFLSTIEIVGRDGVTLAREWADNNPHAYLGGTVPGFPNLFITSAPNSSAGHGGGHNYMTEVSQYFILECMRQVVERGADSIEVTARAEAEFLEQVEAQMAGSIWRHASSAHTYYTNAAGRVILPNPWRMVDYWQWNRVPNLEHFVIRSRPGASR